MVKTPAPDYYLGAGLTNDLKRHEIIGSILRVQKGRPHVKPVWGLWFEERFYFSTSPKSVTGRNISINPSLSVNLESGDDVVILEGTAEVVTDPPFLSRLDEVYYSKYSYHLLHEDGEPAYALRHRVVFAWLERDFTGSATKYRFQL